MTLRSSVVGNRKSLQDHVLKYRGDLYSLVCDTVFFFGKRIYDIYIYTYLWVTFGPIWC